ncbi:DUF6634 family protein [Methylopila sp. M107]|uniref:DUF6634 family protein n=1 Tax=Methylopila sp. M107 TaxID=1101190 RepID=UPI0003794AD7|nr:DUF6634 family protein [Methylopila sp. M107]
MTKSSRDELLLETTKALRAASQAALEGAPVLESWMVDRGFGVRTLVGFVHHSPNFPDGRFIRTSEVRRFVPELGFARTMNRYYRLGLSFEEWRKSQ